MADNLKILIIANARWKGGQSGGDAIYESFKKYWPDCSIRVWDMRNIDYKPFVICYLHRILLGCFMAIFEPNRFDFVYSASDFLPDSLPAFIFKLKGNKWVAGFFLKAFRENRLHYFSQKLVKWLIRKYADMVIVTNKTMYDIFPNKKKTWINGGVDMSLAGLSDERKIYDAVFCGRIHPSKGIDELIEIWKLVREKKPDAKLAVIGDGDLGRNYIYEHFYKLRGKDPVKGFGVYLFGFMGDKRYKIYKQSKVVLYPTPLKYDHFSMAPVEAMACGCHMVCWDTPVMRAIRPKSSIKCRYIWEWPDAILKEGEPYIEWASQFDYKKQSLKVYEDVKKGLFNENTFNGA